MSIIRLNGISKSYGRHTVFRNVYLKIDKGERVGLIGENGSGKTTLFRMMTGREEPDAGTIEMDSGLRIGYFSQFSELDEDCSIEEILDREFAHVHEIETKLSEVEAEMQNPTLSEKELDILIRKQASLMNEMDRFDGWDYPYKIDTVLTKLHFSEKHRQALVSELSGGWKNRACLAQIMIQSPDVLFLDEPTNFLDVSGIAWLSEWIKKQKITVIAVSHDRQFIEDICLKIFDIENCGIDEYKGNYSEYIRQKQMRAREIEREGEHLSEMLLMEENAIRDRAELNRRIQANHSEDAALLKKLTNMKKERATLPSEKIVTSLYRDLYVPEKTVEVANLSVGYGGEPVIGGVSFFLNGGERLCITGPNGSGKSTLIKTLTGELKPISGKIIWGVGQCIFFNQILDELDGSLSVLRNLSDERRIEASRKKVKHFLGMIGLSEQILNEKVGNLSGGQKVRVALTKCLISGCTTILLDEPTNHLDIKTIRILECALVNYPGSVIFVSHDRFFIDNVATRLLYYKEKEKTFENYHGTMEQLEIKNGLS